MAKNDDFIKRGEEICSFWGEISTQTLKSGSFSMCTRSPHPYTCAFASFMIACANDPACDGVVKHLNKEGCLLTVKVTNETVKIKVEAQKGVYNYFSNAYLELYNHLYNAGMRRGF